MKLTLSLAAMILSLAATSMTAHAGNIKNAQDVLGGFLTRAGVEKQEQLSDSQLVDLCEQGYYRAYFLYSGAKARTIKCSSGEIKYSSVHWTNNDTDILEAISYGMDSGQRVFVHCNNGAHASGYIAALALRQFCGYSSSKAFSYWEGHVGIYGKTPPARDKIQKRLKAFEPLPGLSSKCP